MDLIIEISIFGLIYLSAKQIGGFVTKIKLPLISGYLLTGIIVGPYVLNLVTKQAVVDLRFIDEISLAFIAFAAGSELFLKDLRSRLRSIGFVTAGLMIATFTLGVLAVLLLSEYIPFMSGMLPRERLAVALLAGAILVARSPSSAIAIIRELRAKGAFTQMALGVTVIMDVGVIVLFAINTSIADALFTGMTANIGFFLLLLAELLISAGLGFVISKIIEFVFSKHLPSWSKIVFVLSLGFGIFQLSTFIRNISGSYLQFEILIEPLLICMIAGFLIANFNSCCQEFVSIVHQTGPKIYVIFFTLTGASLAIDVLAKTWQIALALFAVRLIGITIGSFTGGVMAKDPMKYNRVSWMAFVTQAGVGLGLAKEVSVEFPEIGSAFATIIIAVIVMNQIIGPPLFKAAIKKVREDNIPERDPDRIRDAVILGIEGASLALAKRLKDHNWKVILADTDPSHVQKLDMEDVDNRWIPAIDEENLSQIFTNATDAVVALMHNDADNLAAITIARDKFGIPRLITRPNGSTQNNSYENNGVLVINPAAALVGLLDQSVRAPDTVAPLLKSNDEYDTIQITISDPEKVNIPLRDFRFPNDILIIRITRHKHSIEPHGFTTFHMNDEVTITGKPESLEFVTKEFGY